MTMVLSSEERNYSSSSSLHQFHLQPEFTRHQPSHSESPSKSKNSSGFNTITSSTNPLSLLAPSPPRALHGNSTTPSHASPPNNLLPNGSTEEDQIIFPLYYDIEYYGQVKDLEPLENLRSHSYTVSVTSSNTLTNVSRQEFLGSFEYAEDDTLLQMQPFRHVDYLSHSWEEEDLWASWRHIVSKRRVYDNSARLENASWRTWTKLKNKLKTVSPESLNWLKDCDVTWLYGPLQTESGRLLRISTSSPARNNYISKPNSFLGRRPILRKRSMLDIILQRPVSASPQLGHTTAVARVLPSKLASPCIREKKRIHFNEQVEQFISLEIGGDDDEDSDPYATSDYDETDSDDGAVMMAKNDSKGKLPLIFTGRRATPQAISSGDCKTIAILPPTTLRYREHTNSCKSTPSLSPGTLRPSKPSSQILLRDELGESDLEEGNADMGPQFLSAFANRNYSVAVTQERLQNLPTSAPSSTLNGDPPDIPLRMFMGSKEAKDKVVSKGVFEKAVNTASTAKDIAYVIWNFSWRRVVR